MGDSYVDLDPEEISEQQAMTDAKEEGGVVFNDAGVVEESAPVSTVLKSEIAQPGFDQGMPF
ncbi:hypothetical protein RSF21_002408 [Yersinia enterocolitica]|nr:hypothetical protein [Yersinia enterocolitica]